MFFHIFWYYKDCIIPGYPIASRFANVVCDNPQLNRSHPSPSRRLQRFLFLWTPAICLPFVSPIERIAYGTLRRLGSRQSRCIRDLEMLGQPPLLEYPAIYNNVVIQFFRKLPSKNLLYTSLLVRVDTYEQLGLLCTTLD